MKRRSGRSSPDFKGFSKREKLEAEQMINTHKNLIAVSQLNAEFMEKSQELVDANATICDVTAKYEVLRFQVGHLEKMLYVEQKFVNLHEFKFQRQQEEVIRMREKMEIAQIEQREYRQQATINFNMIKVDCNVAEQRVERLIEENYRLRSELYFTKAQLKSCQNDLTTCKTHNENLNDHNHKIVNDIIRRGLTDSMDQAIQCDIEHCGESDQKQMEDKEIQSEETGDERDEIATQCEIGRDQSEDKAVQCKIHATKLCNLM